MPIQETMHRSAKLPKLKSSLKKTAPKRTSKVTKLKTIDVVVSLTVEDHKSATVAAKISHQTVAIWISSMVNMWLKPP